MKLISIIIIFLIGFVSGIVFVSMAPSFDNTGIPEVKLNLANMEKAGSGNYMGSQLKEYIKARLYLNVTYHSDPSWLEGMKLDYGPIEPSHLENIHWSKEPMRTDELYEEFQVKIAELKSNK